MENELEVQDSLNTESEQDTTPDIDQAEIEKSEQVVKNYQTRLYKAKDEASKLKKEAEMAEQEVKALKTSRENETPKNEKSNEPDYARLAFLESKSVKHPDDQKIVLDEAERLKLPLTDILNMEHIKSKLKDLNDQREAQDGMPKGKGRAGGANQGDVDYWIAKGQAPDDPELRDKYFEARIKKESDGNKFSDDLYNE